MKRKLFFILFLGLISSSAFSQARLSLQAGAQVPTSDFAELAGTGFGFTGTFEFLLNENVSLTAAAGYNSWGPADDLEEGWDYSLTSIPILGGVRVYLSRGDFHIYLGGELGVHLVSFEITREIGGTELELNVDDSESRFGFAPIFGFRYHVSPTVDLDFNFKYNVISTDNDDGTYFGINGGVQFGL